MPIVARPPGLGSLGMSRSGGDASNGGSAPPGGLLPPGGAIPTAPALAPHRALALDALRVMRNLHDRPRDAGFWGEPAFAREVDLVRGHLAPISTRRALAASFGREAFHGPGVVGRREPSGFRPVRIAYAVRWLELGDGQSRPAWSDLVTGRD